MVNMILFYCSSFSLHGICLRYVSSSRIDSPSRSRSTQVSLGVHLGFSSYLRDHIVYGGTHTLVVFSMFYASNVSRITSFRIDWSWDKFQRSFQFLSVISRLSPVFYLKFSPNVPSIHRLSLIKLSSCVFVYFCSSTFRWIVSLIFLNLASLWPMALSFS